MSSQLIRGSLAHLALVLDDIKWEHVPSELSLGDLQNESREVAQRVTLDYTMDLINKEIPYCSFKASLIFSADRSVPSISLEQNSRVSLNEWLDKPYFTDPRKDAANARYPELTVRDGQAVLNMALGFLARCWPDYWSRPEDVYARSQPKKAIQQAMSNVTDAEFAELARKTREASNG